MLRTWTWTVPPPLGRHVRAIWRIRGRATMSDWLLPDVAGADLAVHLGDPGRVCLEDGWRRQPERWAVGGLSRAIPIAHDGQVDVIGIQLGPGCGCLLGIPAADLRDQALPLAEVAPRLDRELEAWTVRVRGGHTGSKAEEIAALLRLLQTHLRLRCDPAVARAAASLASGDAGRIAALARDLGLSGRQLGRRFQAAVGTSPRQFARVARFSRVLRAVESTPPASWASLALEHGYCDQAHLAREFRALAGAPPTRLLTPDWYKGVTVGPARSLSI